LLPRLPNDLPEQYKFLVPRPQFGAMINTAGKTSYGYAGVVWTLNILPQFFLEPMFGGAVHDGNATATPVPDENTLGCRVLFHTGLSGGYRLTEHYMGTSMSRTKTWPRVPLSYFLCSTDLNFGRDHPFVRPAEPILPSRPTGSQARRAQGQSRMAVVQLVQRALHFQATP
jgi:hypothetical protein